MTPPDRIKGIIRYKPNFRELRDEREAWITEAIVAGMKRRQIADALHSSVGSLNAVLTRLGAPSERGAKGSAKAAAAAQAKFRARREARCNGVTFAELHAAGFCVAEAAAMHGDKTAHPARKWAKDHGLSWPDGRSSEKARERARKGYLLHEDRRVEGYHKRLNDPDRHHLASLTPEQRRLYDLCRHHRMTSDEAAAAVGCPEAGLKAHKARQQQRDELRKLIRQDPEAALLRMMQAPQ